MILASKIVIIWPLYVLCYVRFTCLDSFRHYTKSDDYYLKSVFAYLCDRWPANIENTSMVNNTKFIYSKGNQNVKLYIWLPSGGLLKKFLRTSPQDNVAEEWLRTCQDALHKDTYHARASYSVHVNKKSLGQNKQS